MSGIGLSWDKRERRSTDTFQNELRAKLKQRHSMGMAVDVASSEEDSDDGDDSRHDDFMSQFFPKSVEKRGSIERRSPLTDNLRRASGHPGMSSSNLLSDSFDEVDAGPHDATINKRLSPAQAKKEAVVLPQATNRFMKAGAKKDGGLVSAKENERPLTKEEIIFGRKAVEESAAEGPKKPWTPPSFRKASLVEAEEEPTTVTATARATSPASSKGRRTPSLEPSLGTISETPTPQSRKSRGGSIDLTDSLTPRSLRRESSRDAGEIRRGSTKQESVDVVDSGLPKMTPRGSVSKGQGKDVGSTLDDITKPVAPSRKQDKTPPPRSSMSEIFGRRRSSAQEPEPETNLFETPQKPEPSSRMTRKNSTADDRKSPDRKITRGKSPIATKSSTTPTPKRRPSSSRSDTRSPEMSSPTSVTKGDTVLIRKAPDEERKTPSILDFLTQDTEPKVKPRSRQQQKSEKSVDSVDSGNLFESSHRRVSREKLNASPKRVVDKSHKTMKRDNQVVSPYRFIDDEQSSVCEEVKEDPTMTRDVTDGDMRKISTNINPKQTTEHIAADAAIHAVAGVQDGLSNTMRYIHPDQVDGGKISDRNSNVHKTHNPKQMTEHIAADAAIHAVAGVQDGLSNTMRYIHPDQVDSGKIPKASQSKTPRHKPKPRYGTPDDNTPRSDVSYDDTVSIRNAVYDGWVKERTAKTRAEARERKRLKDEEEEKLKKKNEEKCMEAKLSYDHWVKDKNRALSAKVRTEQRQESEKAKKEREDEAEKMKDADSSFKNWKTKKDSITKDQHKKERKLEVDRLQGIQNQKDVKKEKSLELYDKWKSKKDQIITEKQKKEKEEADNLRETQKRENRLRDKSARKLYTEWIVKKEIADKRQRETLRRNKYHSMEEIMPPWSPAG